MKTLSAWQHDFIKEGWAGSPQLQKAGWIPSPPPPIKHSPPPPSPPPPKPSVWEMFLSKKRAIFQGIY